MSCTPPLLMIMILRQIAVPSIRVNFFNMNFVFSSLWFLAAANTGRTCPTADGHECEATGAEIQFAEVPRFCQNKSTKLFRCDNVYGIGTGTAMCHLPTRTR